MTIRTFPRLPTTVLALALPFVFLVIHPAFGQHDSPAAPPGQSVPPADTAASTPDPGEHDAIFDLSLEELSDVPVEKVQSASRYEQESTDAPATVTVITAEEIRRLGFRTLADVLRSVRGFYTTYDRNYTYVGLRGFGRLGDYNNRILVLVDGIRVNDPVYDGVLIGEGFLVDADLMERVEVIRGPGSSLYGSNAFFAVVNVVTRSAERVGGVEVAGSAASFATYKGRATWGRAFENGWSVVLSGSAQASQGQDLYFPVFDDPSTDNGWARHADGEDAQHLYARVGRGGFSLTAAFSRRFKEIPTAPWETVFNDDGTSTRDTTALVDLRYAGPAGNLGELTARIYAGLYDYAGRYVYDTGPSQDRSWGRWAGTEVLLSRPLLERHRLVVGADFQRDWRQDQKYYDDTAVYLDDQRDSDRWSVFGQGELRPIDEVIVNAGVRYDHYSTFGGTTNPRLAAIVKPWTGTVLKAIYGTAFRAPSPYELYYNDGGATQKANPDLDPETVVTSELAVEQALGRGVHVHASAFVYRVKDLITAVEESGVAVFQNVDRARARGVDLGIEGRLKNGLQGRLGYTFTDAENAATGEQLTNSPRHVGKVNLIVPVVRERLFGGVELLYTGPRKTLAGHRTDAACVVNATLTAPELAPGLTLSASVYNLLDQRYTQPALSEHRQDVIEQDGLNFRLQLTWRF